MGCRERHPRVLSYMTRTRGGEHGAVSVQVFIILVFLSAMLAGGGLYLGAVSRRVSVYRERSETRDRLVSVSDEVLRALAEDPTPEADSSADPVWRTVAGLSADGLSVTLEDVSSRINPNWAMKGLFAKTDLGALFLPGANEDRLQLDLAAGYGEFFGADALEKFFTPYGWANLNVTDEFAFRALAAARTNSITRGEAFHAKVQEALRALRIVRREELREFLGTEFDALYPVVNAEPVWNLHFLPPEILRAVLSYPEYGVENPAAAASALGSFVKTGELGPDAIEGFLGKPRPNRLYEYLGTVTWFWKIVAATEGMRLVTVAARLPELSGRTTGGGGVPVQGAAPEFVIVERRFIE
jgi:hypothetical protein